MQASPERISYLFRQHFEGTLSGEERRDFFDLVNAGANDPFIKDLMSDAWQQYLPDRKAPEIWSEAVLEEILKPRKKANTAGRVYFSGNRWLRYAAAVILLAGAGAYLYTANSRKAASTAFREGQGVQDKPPGRNGAILTLADGSAIVLDSLANGVVTTQQGSSLVLADGRLAYNPTASIQGEPVYNTISTPRGRQFQLVLPDGSRIWLNAASSVRFPTAFTGKERNIVITGEAYLEVKQNRERPFRVLTNGMQVEVLGTSFNINAYEDEQSVKTTLITGSVKTTGGDNNLSHKKDMSVVLHPGEQSRFNGQQLSVSGNVDVDQVVAWKNGLFNFQDAPFAEVMRQLARWYDIDVRYESNIPVIEFEGKLGRDVSLSRMLVFFRESGVNCRMENGNTLVVSRK